jgi:hypothetical protein
LKPDKCYDSSEEITTGELAIGVIRTVSDQEADAARNTSARHSHGGLTPLTATNFAGEVFATALKSHAQ